MVSVDVKLFIEKESGEDSRDVIELADDLKAELGHSCEGEIDSLFEEAQPGTTPGKGPLAMAGALLVRLGEGEGPVGLLRSLFSWLARTDRAVEISVNGVEMKLTRSTPEQQERIVQAVLERIAAGS